MSKLNNTLKIEPPKLLGSNHNGETFSSHGHTCTYCNGHRTFSEQVTYDEYKTKDCPVCKGVGKLQAKIVIGWLPDNVLK